ncbi:hypothetical protein ACKWRH_05625 [Bradyrhizobium sp. Pa8]|uniref:hypothetical protein n=1 Tax=Bradyrhizobium sp. Pa8 TaxID=3386552 RepID=UPI00403F4324
MQVKTKVHFSNDSGRSDYDVVDYLIRTPEEASGSTDGYSPSSGQPVPRISAAEVEKAHQSREFIELCINDCHGSAKWRCRISDAYQDCVESVDCMTRIAVSQTVDWVLDFRLCHGWYDAWERGT